MYQFLRRQELCFPEKKPSGAELERQAAFSSTHWLETVVTAPVCVWRWVLCFRGSLMQPHRLWAAPHLVQWHGEDVRPGGQSPGLGASACGAGRLLSRCPLPHWVATLSTAVLCMDTRPGPSCSANQQRASALGAREQRTHLSLWGQCFKINALGPWPALRRPQRHFPFRSASECAASCSHLKAEHSWGNSSERVAVLVQATQLKPVGAGTRTRVSWQMHCDDFLYTFVLSQLAFDVMLMMMLMKVTYRSLIEFLSYQRPCTHICLS